MQFEGDAENEKRHTIHSPLLGKRETIAPDPKLPPPKWKIGLVVFLTGVLWSFVLHVVKFDTFAVSNYSSNPYLFNLVVTAANLLPVFFILAPIFAWTVQCWMDQPAYRPSDETTIGKIFLFFFF